MSAFLSRLFKPGRRGLLISSLMEEEPRLAQAFLWKTNCLPQAVPDPLWLHLGCGEHVLDGFLNLDFLPNDARVAEWEFLDPWPKRWPVAASGAFSEDTLEHFFLAEQLHILCEMNGVLAPGAAFRVLMPSYTRLLEYCRGFMPRPDEFLHATMGVETEADAVNAGLRFSGHRWLHDDASLAHLARLAGFEAVKTSCAESTVAFLSGRNLRAEKDSASFAHDLVKRTSLARTSVIAAPGSGLEVLETVGEGIAFARIRDQGARIGYRLPQPMRASDIACLNVRGANLSSFREHSLKRLVFRGPWGEGAWPLDETLKSKACMNLAMPAAIGLACGGADRIIEEVSFEPGKVGDSVSVGPLEMFVHRREAG